MRDFDEHALLSDYRFLEEAAAAGETARRAIPQLPALQRPEVARDLLIQVWPDGNITVQWLIASPCTVTRAAISYPRLNSVPRPVCSCNFNFVQDSPLFVVNLRKMST